MRKESKIKPWMIAAAVILLGSGAAVAITDAIRVNAVDFADGQTIGLSAANHGRIRYNNSSHILEQSLNGGAYGAFGGGGGSIGGSIASNQVAFGSGANTIQGASSLTFTGTALSVAPTATSSGSTPPVSIVTPASTAQTASTEVPGATLDFSATRQWSTGNFATQRELFIKSPTYSFVGASTITNAATLDIQGAPAQGTNATITNPWALRVEAGQSSFGGAVTAPRTVMGGSAPTPTAGANMGSGGSLAISLAGRDEAGVVTATFGNTAPTGDGVLFTITYAGGAYPNGSTCGIYFNDNTTASGLNQFVASRVMDASGTTTTCVVRSNFSAGPANGTVYVFNYWARGW